MPQQYLSKLKTQAAEEHASILYHNNKIIFKLCFQNRQSTYFIYLNSRPKEIYVKKYASLFHIFFFFHDRSIHPLYFLEHLAQRESTGALLSGGKKRRDDVTRLVIQIPTQRGRLDTYSPWVDESCTRERRERATLLAASSAMYRESSTWVANIARGSARDASSFEPIFVLRDGNTRNAMEWSLKALLYSIIRGTGGNPSKIRANSRIRFSMDF